MRCSIARAPPRTSSTATDETSSTGEVVSSRTTSIPRSRRASRLSSEPADGVTMTPCTPCSSNSRRYRASRSGSSSEDDSMSVYSSAANRSSTPRATSVKNGFAMSSTMAPTVWMVPARSCRAEALRTNCSSSIASRTRSRVVSLTWSGRLSTLETVPTDTPARLATSVMDGRRSARPRVVVDIEPLFVAQSAGAVRIRVVRGPRAVRTCVGPVRRLCAAHGRC